MDLNALSRWESISEDLQALNRDPATGPDSALPRGAGPHRRAASLSRGGAAQRATAHRSSAAPQPPPSSSLVSSSHVPRLPSLGSIGEASTSGPSSSDSLLSLASPSLPGSPSSTGTPSPLTSPVGSLLRVYDSYDALPVKEREARGPRSAPQSTRAAEADRGKANGGAAEERREADERTATAEEVGSAVAIVAAATREAVDRPEQARTRVRVALPAGWYSGWLYRACRRFAKGLTLGFAGKSGFALLALLVKSGFNVRRIAAYPYVASALAGEPVAYGLFLGSLLAGLQACTDTLGPSAFPHSAIANTALSASVASASLYFLPQSHRASVCLFFAVRALEVACRWLGRRYADALPAVLREQVGTVVFCLGSAEICWAALYHTHALEPSYMAFLNAHSGMAVHAQLPLAAHVHHAYNAQQPPFPTALRSFNALRQAKALPPLEMSAPFLHCQILHPGLGCASSVLTFFVAAFRRALPVYVPVYVIPLLLFRVRRLLSAPLSVLPRLALSIGRSSLFLSLYCSTGWAWMCLFRHLGAEHGRQSHALLSGLLTGLCVLVEKRERRMELGLYVLSHALHAAWSLAVDFRLLNDHPALLYALLAAALTVLLTAFQADVARGKDADGAALLRPSYASLFAYFVGKRKLQAEQQRIQLSSSTTPCKAI